MKRIWKILTAVGILCALSGGILSGVALAMNPQLRHFPGTEASQLHEMWRKLYARMDGRTDAFTETETISVYEENDWETWGGYEAHHGSRWGHDEEHDIEHQIEHEAEQYWEEWEHEWEEEHAHFTENENFSDYQELKAGKRFKNVQKIQIQAGNRKVLLIEDASVQDVTVAECEPCKEGDEAMVAKFSKNTLKICESDFFNHSFDDLSDEQWMQKVQKILEKKEEEELRVLRILVPQGFRLEELELQMQQGMFWAEGANVEEMELECAGTTTLYDCCVRELDVKHVGYLYFEGDISKEADIKSVGGSVELMLDGEKDDFHYEIECVSSTVNLDGTTKSGSVFKLEEGTSSAKKIEIECVSSEVSIAFQ